LQFKRQILDRTINTAPSYTVVHDNETDTYQCLQYTYTGITSSSSYITNERKTILQLLNITIWTNNKAQKKEDWTQNFNQCGNPESMEHLFHECENYSQLLWERTGEVLTLYLNRLSKDYCTYRHTVVRFLTMFLTHSWCFIYKKILE
jgi:hypothetical protein